MAANTSPFTPEMKACPYPAYDEWRAESPVLWSDELEAWIVTGYAEAQHVLLNHELFSSANSVFGGPQTEHPEFPSIINIDEPRHRKLRALVAKAFTPKTLDAVWEPRICGLIDEMLDAVCAKETFDVVADLAYPLPVKMIAEIIGVDSDEFEYFKERSGATVAIIGRLPYRALDSEGEHDHEPRDGDVKPLTEYFLEQVQDRREHPRDDLLTKLIEAEVDGEHLDDVEIVAFLMLLLIAGNETTTNLIAQAVRALVEHPGLMERARSSPKLVEKLIEEALRREAPIQGFYRRATRDTRLAGMAIASGDALLVMYGAANRDGARYDRPAEFAVERRARDHLAFGAGIHFCLGANLARLEARLAIEGVLKRFEALVLAEGFEPAWANTPFFRGMVEYELTFRPAGQAGLATGEAGPPCSDSLRNRRAL